MTEIWINFKVLRFGVILQGFGVIFINLVEIWNNLAEIWSNLRLRRFRVIWQRFAVINWHLRRNLRRHAEEFLYLEMFYGI